MKLVCAAVLLSLTILGKASAEIRGAVSKPAGTIDAVLAHYNEDLQWISEAKEKYASYQVRYIVYTKSKPSVPRAHQADMEIELPNIGREAHTYLHHIVENYDNLSDWTVFSQAVAPKFGFRPGDSTSGHMSSGVVWEDYLRAFAENDGDFYAVYSSAAKFPEISITDRFDLTFFLPDSDGNVCPSVEDWGMWWWSENFPINYIMKHQRGTSKDPLSFFNDLIAVDEDEWLEDFTVAFPCGARFAVSRERIQKRPRHFYENLLREFKDVWAVEAYYMEMFWYDTFHPERLQAQHGVNCVLPPYPVDGAIDSQVARDAMDEEYKNRYGMKATQVRDLEISGKYEISTLSGTSTLLLGVVSLIPLLVLSAIFAFNIVN